VCLVVGPFNGASRWRFGASRCANLGSGNVSAYYAAENPREAYSLAAVGRRTAPVSAKLDDRHDVTVGNLQRDEGLSLGFSAILVMMDMD